MTARRALAVLFVVFNVTGCQSVPTEQIRVFSTALTAVQEADKPILADLGLAEDRGRAIRIRTRDAAKDPNRDCGGGPIRDTGVRDNFCLNDVDLFADIVKPPDATAFQAGMDTLRQYTDTLSVLAEGKNAADTATQLQGIAGNLQAVATTLGVVGGAATPIGPAISELSGIITQASMQLSKDEARRLILGGNVEVQKIIKTERDAAPAIWDVITNDWRRQLRITRDAKTVKDLADKIETYRKIISNRVIMLDRLKTAWGKLEAATLKPQPATLADLTALTAQIKSDADSVTKAYALLRAGQTK